MDSAVAKRYASALFNTAKRADKLAVVEDDLHRIVEVAQSKPEFMRYLTGPNASRSEKQEMLKKLFGQEADPLTMSLLRLMLEKRREALIPQVSAAFSQLRRAEEKVLSAHVVSAMELDDAAKSQIVSRVEKATGQRIEAEFSVDESLIGGVRVAYGDYVLDGSIRGSISRMREQILYNVLKQA